MLYNQIYNDYILYSLNHMHKLSFHYLKLKLKSKYELVNIKSMNTKYLSKCLF